MRIEAIEVDGFGVWSDVTVPELSPEITVVYGRNEAGKTTLMQFVRAMLYGFSADRTDRYLPPVRGGKGGGRLRLTSSTGDYTLQRQSEAHGDVSTRGLFSLHDSLGTRQPESLLDSLMAGVDESIYQNVFAVGLRELQELATLSATDAADHLYKLTSGLDRVSLVDVVREVQGARTELFDGGSGRGAIRDLLRHRERLVTEINDLAASGGRWSSLAGQRDLLVRDAEQVQKRIDEHEARVKLLEACLNVRDHWLARKMVDEQLRLLGQIPDVDPKSLERLDELNGLAVQREQRIDALFAQRQGLRADADKMPLNRRVLERAPRIEALGEHAPWLESLESQIERLRADIHVLESENDSHKDQFMLPGGIRLSSIPDLSQKTLAALKSPAAGLREYSGKLGQLDSELKVAHGELEETTLELEAALSEIGKHDLNESLEEQGERATQLRRRIQLEERIGKMARDREELERECQQLMDEQVMPFWKLVAMCIPFCLGVLMILGGITWSAMTFSGLGVIVTLLGVAGMGAAIAMKITVERSAEREFDACNRQLEQVTSQLRLGRREIEELDHLLPASQVPLSNQLKEAEQEIALLESYLPLEQKRRAAQQRRETAEERYRDCKDRMDEAQRRWEKAVANCGLPDGVSPRHVKLLSNRSEHMLQLQRRLEQRYDDMKNAERELKSLRARIDQHFVESGLEKQTDDAQLQLRQLLTALQTQKDLVDRRRGLKKQFEELSRDLKKERRALDRLKRKRDLLFASAGAEDETRFRQLVAKRKQADRLLGEREEISSRIRAAVGMHYPEETIAAELEAETSSQIPQIRASVLAEERELEKKLSELHGKRGELTQEMKSLAGDRRLAKARLELQCVEAKLDETSWNWRVLSVTGGLLESIREIYENERQPQTLAEASEYLAKITRGQYVRIWTPMGDDVLRVDDGDGKPYRLDVLSQGTREAIFLCLRLALAAAYAKRGAHLPLVLDDVLVNFDNARAMHAAEVFRDFASRGYQMLLFTCHEHIFDIFRRMEVDVRTLPTNRERGQVVSRSMFEPTPYIEPVAVEEEPEIPEPEFGEVASFEPEVAPEPEPEPEVVLEDEPEPARKHPFRARSIRKKRRDVLFGPPAPEPEKAPEPEPVVELPVVVESTPATPTPPEPVKVRELPRPRGFRLVPADWAIRANKTIVERDIRLADIALEADSLAAPRREASAEETPVADVASADADAAFDAFAEADLDEPIVEIDEEFEAFPAATLTWGQPSETWSDRPDDLV
jgi:uncharacterized protein YhaN